MWMQTRDRSSCRASAVHSIRPTAHPCSTRQGSEARTCPRYLRLPTSASPLFSLPISTTPRILPRLSTGGRRSRAQGAEGGNGTTVRGQPTWLKPQRTSLKPHHALKAGGESEALGATLRNDASSGQRQIASMVAQRRAQQAAAARQDSAAHAGDESEAHGVLHDVLGGLLHALRCASLYAPQGDGARGRDAGNMLARSVTRQACHIPCVVTPILATTVLGDAHQPSVGAPGPEGATFGDD